MSRTGTGPQTLTAVQSADQTVLYARYRQGRIDYYRDLATSHPLLQRFVPGWLARAHGFPTQLPATE
ncbi:putative peptidoglycan-binding domain-containing protein [Lysobacter sp. CA199]|uniref:putative peptidoglycan-binding domain-containing protein n=1 Tax=Lysobacter sp. CA199 TaxID=3455608 RepID=UPI003F8D4C7C